MVDKDKQSTLFTQKHNSSEDTGSVNALCIEWIGKELWSSVFFYGHTSTFKINVSLIMKKLRNFSSLISSYYFASKHTE